MRPIIRSVDILFKTGRRVGLVCQNQTLRETEAVLEAGVQVVFISWFSMPL